MYKFHNNLKKLNIYYRGISKNITSSKMELFVTLVNGFQLLNNATNSCVLDVAVVLNTPLNYTCFLYKA